MIHCFFSLLFQVNKRNFVKNLKDIQNIDAIKSAHLYRSREGKNIYQIDNISIQNEFG